MPYPVLPPDPPAIVSQLSVVSTEQSAVNSLAATNDTPLLTKDNFLEPVNHLPSDRLGKPLSLGKISQTKEQSQAISQELPTNNSVLTLANHQNSDPTTPTISVTPTEDLLPHPSSTVKSAAMLGSPLSVIVPSPAVETTPDLAHPTENNSDNHSKQISPAAAVTLVDGILASGSECRDAQKHPSSEKRAECLLNQKQNDLKPTDTLPQFPSPVPIKAEISPAEHIGPTIGPIQIVPSTQRRNSGSRQPSSTNTTPANPPIITGVIELTSDRQEYDAIREIFTGEGNVLMRYQGGVINADRVQGNLLNRITVAEGNVAFRRGQQLLRGQRLVYNLLQDSGTIRNGRGQIFVPTTGTDLAFNLPNTGVIPPIVADRPLSDRLLENQPAQQITNPGEINFVFGGTRPGSGLPPFNQGGQINRFRFEAENIDFYPRGWIARNVRLTNDPFSPPELEIRADKAIFTQLTPLRDEVRLTNPHLVFDQGLSIPILRSRYVFDRSPSEPPLIQFGYDARERGGVYIERNFNIYSSPQVRFSITPQFFIQRAISQGFDNPAELFGVRSRLSASLGPRTVVGAAVVVNNFDPELMEEKVRASMRLVQIIGTNFPHRLTLEYSYRDRLFNGSLGYQTVQQSIGGVLTSPVFQLGKTGANLTYQVGAQYINADTDRADLLAPIRDNNRVDLGRFQASVSVVRPIRLWRGKPLPATPTEGLRYTPVPVVPNIQLVPSINGTTTLYTNGDTQNTFTGSISLSGQFGHFSKRFLDYTGFNIRYSQVFIDGESPFLFDRIVDKRVLSFGFSQQIYGPFRIGFQTAINLDTNQSISTDYFVEYSRRTYGITLRYNPDLQLGALLFRISDFNWNNGGQPFGGSGVRFVDTGVLQDY